MYHLVTERPDTRPIPTDRRAWGYYIKRTRKARGLTTQTAATMLGVSRTTLTHWESLGASPLPRYVPQIVNWLGFVPLCRSPYQATVGQAIQAVRELKGWDQKQVRNRLRIAPETLIAAEKDRPVLRETLDRIETVLRVPIRWLVANWAEFNSSIRSSK